MSLVFDLGNSSSFCRVLKVICARVISLFYVIEFFFFAQQKWLLGLLPMDLFQLVSMPT